MEIKESSAPLEQHFCVAKLDRIEPKKGNSWQKAFEQQKTLLLFSEGQKKAVSLEFLDVSR
jgi:hypothetical protein